MLLRRVAKDVMSSLLSFHKRYDFTAANFRRHSQWKCALQANELELIIVLFHVFSGGELTYDRVTLAHSALNTRDEIWW